jgi:ABC-2 type transport system ATP-binding protein
MNILEVYDLWYRRSRRSEWLLREVSLRLTAGTRCAIFGASGSGKTILADLITGLRKPSQGNVSLAGRVGYVTQRFTGYPDLTVAENLEFFEAARPGNSWARSRILRETGLQGREHQRAGSLPSNPQRMLQLACALTAGPDLLLLDDTDSGLDTGFRTRLVSILDQLVLDGTAVLICTADQGLASGCDQVRHLIGGALSAVNSQSFVVSDGKEASL